MSRLGDLGGRLHRGDIGLNFIGRRKIWYLISLVLVAISLGGLGFKGLEMGVEFRGGAVFTTPAGTELSVEDARDTASSVSGRDAKVQRLGNDSLRITVTGLDTDNQGETREALAKDLGIPAGDLNAELVGPSWGEQMTSKALTGMVIFLVLVSVYLAIAFEWRMAVAALVALVHDLVITVGVYAIVGFEVTPGTVVGLLTILGYSLYDTVVVFDKVRENTATLSDDSRHTYAELANQGVNGTVVRSINTSIVALLPVAALLFIGAGLLGGGMLKDIALSLFVGLTAGTYSSIMIATPVVVDLKNRDPAVKAHDKRVLHKRAKRAEAGGSDEDELNDVPRTGADLAAEQVDDAPDDVSDATATVGAGPIAGQRRTQPQSRARGRGRPSGKRR
ncbi:protein translocase subunit SecF [Streptomyces apocyni]|uniref:protein translocase subunit SecF n=1 Tax=Streptomyces apocyni TaxID=2654677 RepID=UPI0012EA601D|nr:protein translocase subunit SecF [Streptomyces apocyni]